MSSPISLRLLFFSSLLDIGWVLFSAVKGCTHYERVRTKVIYIPVILGEK